MYIYCMYAGMYVCMYVCMYLCIEKIKNNHFQCFGYIYIN